MEIHTVVAYHCTACGHSWPASEHPTKCPNCGTALAQPTGTPMKPKQPTLFGEPPPTPTTDDVLATVEAIYIAYVQYGEDSAEVVHLVKRLVDQWDRMLG